MKIVLIRHGETKGNELKVYLGQTDELLSENGIRMIKSNFSEKIYPNVEHIYVSPMKRCLETMKIIYQNLDYTIVDDLKECNFGNFEYMSYEQLKDNYDYQKWIESGGNIAFPKGESKLEFSQRSIAAFENIIDTAIISGQENIAVICHGGTIMAIMERFEKSHKSFYEWQIKNGDGFVNEIDEKVWDTDKKMSLTKKICSNKAD
ncbi:MAG: histidine phosphatase family protein [Oscillospiraceae bacterium]